LDFRPIRPTHRVLQSERVVRVLLVEHPAAVRRALRESLLHESDIEIVGEASSMQPALRIAERLRPDAVVLDWEMNGVDVPEAVAGLRARAPETSVVVVAMDPERVARMFTDDAGVAVVGKIDGVAALVAALRLRGDTE
jgi:DNA-binding NarL/FixJ family response regulator